MWVGGGAWFARPHSCHESAGSYVSMGGGRVGAGADYRSSCGVGGGAWFARPHSCHESAGSYVSMGVPVAKLKFESTYKVSRLCR